MLAHTLVTSWHRILAPRSTAVERTNGQAAIHRYDAVDDQSAWTRCRDRARFHLGRARRAKDHGRFRDAAREIERALRYDDTSEAYFQVLGQCYLEAMPPDLQAARGALERAFTLNPRNGYTIKLLLRLCELADDQLSARRAVDRALASGAALPWLRTASEGPGATLAGTAGA